MNNIMNYTKEMLEKEFLKKYTAIQIMDWIYNKKVYEFEDFSNVSKK